MATRGSGRTAGPVGDKSRSASGPLGQRHAPCNFTGHSRARASELTIRDAPERSAKERDTSKPKSSNYSWSQAPICLWMPSLRAGVCASLKTEASAWASVSAGSPTNMRRQCPKEVGTPSEHGRYCRTKFTVSPGSHWEAATPSRMSGFRSVRKSTSRPL